MASGKLVGSITPTEMVGSVPRSFGLTEMEFAAPPSEERATVSSAAAGCVGSLSGVMAWARAVADPIEMMATDSRANDHALRIVRRHNHEGRHTNSLFERVVFGK